MESEVSKLVSWTPHSSLLPNPCDGGLVQNIYHFYHLPTHSSSFHSKATSPRNLPWLSLSPLRINYRVNVFSLCLFVYFETVLSITCWPRSCVIYYSTLPLWTFSGPQSLSTKLSPIHLFFSGPSTETGWSENTFWIIKWNNWRSSLIDMAGKVLRQRLAGVT